MIKKISLLFFLFLLNNCASSGSAFLGPIITGVKTGSISQTSLSYSTGRLISEAQPTFTKPQNPKDIFKINVKLPDIPYSDHDPIIQTFYKVDKIYLSKVIEPEPLP
tara:strand:+ start:292 stop:612 length:321 start_codon:yes stop_codon:yes gene_type:complete